MDSIEVSDSLTIGGAEPLGQDAIDKLQAQIINPIQHIHVDQKIGNDNNDGTSASKAVQTFDKAITLIKPYTDTVRFVLHTYTEKNDLKYNKFVVTTPIASNNVNTYSFWRSTKISPAYNDPILAEIVVPYGKVGVGTEKNGKPLYAWGWMLLINCENIDCNYVKFSFPEETVINRNKVINAVFYNCSGNFYIDNGDINNEAFFITSDNKYLFNFIHVFDIDKIEFYRSKVEGDTLLTHNNYPLKIYTNDPIATDGGDSNNSNYGLGGIISKYINSQSSFSSGALGSTNGLADKTKAIYTQGFD